MSGGVDTAVSEAINLWNSQGGEWPYLALGSGDSPDNTLAIGFQLGSSPNTLGNCSDGAPFYTPAAQGSFTHGGVLYPNAIFVFQLSGCGLSPTFGVGSPYTDPANMFNLFAHEIGHHVGLGHDDCANGVMNGNGQRLYDGTRKTVTPEEVKLASFLNQLGQTHTLRVAAVWPPFNSFTSTVGLTAEFTRPDGKGSNEVLNVSSWLTEFAFTTPLVDGTTFHVVASIPADLDCFFGPDTGTISGGDEELRLFCLNKTPTFCDQYPHACAEAGVNDPDEVPWNVAWFCTSDSVDTANQVPCVDSTTGEVLPGDECSEVVTHTTQHCVHLCWGGYCRGDELTVPGPEVSLWVPHDGATVNGRVAVRGSAYHPSGTVDGVSVWVDNQPVELVNYQTGLYAPSACNGQKGCDPFVGFLGFLDTDGLTPGGHTLKVISVENVSTTPGITIFERSFAVDRTPPAVSISAPSNGAVVNGTVSVTASASDNMGVAKVEFRVDGAVASTDTVAPFAYNWNSANATNGSHTLVARAFDGAGNSTSSSSVVVTVANNAPPPQVAVTWPAAGSAVRGQVSLQAQASDSLGINRVEFYVDGGLLGLDTTAPYTQSWNTSTSADGNHSLTAKAFNVGGSSATSAPVAVRVDNTPPHVGVESPYTGALVWGPSTRVGGWATDASRVTALAFKVDGQSLTLNGPYSYGAWRPDVCNVYPGDPDCPAVGWEAYFNSTTLTDGAHSLQVVVTDGVGLTTPTDITFAVDNRPLSPPAMYIDYPLEGISVSGGAVNLEGWALDPQRIASLTFEIDAMPLVLNAPYSAVNRADACAAYGNVDPTCPNVGWRTSFDSRRYADGAHTLSVVATDRRGEQSRFNRSIRIANAPGSIETRFPVIADSYIAENFPTSNFGTAQSLWVRGSEDGAHATKYAFLKFLVANLTSPVTSARLRIRTGSSTIGALKVYNVFSSDWSETGLTWSNAPWSSSFMMWAYGLAPDTWYELDVTSAVTGNGRFTIGLGSADGADRGFFSAQSGYPAELLVYH